MRVVINLLSRSTEYDEWTGKLDIFLPNLLRNIARLPVGLVILSSASHP